MSKYSPNYFKTTVTAYCPLLTKDLRPRTSDGVTQRDETAATALASMSIHEQALVTQLVARIEHLSADVANYDASRQLREDNLLLRKDLQVNHSHFLAV